MADTLGEKPKLLIIYGQMFRNGYVVYGGYSVNLPENWTERLQPLNTIYSKGFTEIYSS